MWYTCLSDKFPIRPHILDSLKSLLSDPFCTQLWELQPVAFQLSKMADLYRMTNNPRRHKFTFPSASEVVGTTGLYEVQQHDVSSLNIVVVNVDNARYD